MLTHIKQHFNHLFIRFLSHFIVVFTFSTVDYSFGLLALISKVLETKKNVK